MKFPRFLQIAALILLAAGAQPAYSAYWQWSKTAATNSGADPSINWAEGQSPSSINDSARAMMARTAEYRDDISGLLATAGTSTAYTVTTNQGLASVPNDGQLLAVTVHATNGTSPTLTADGGTTYPIQSSPGVAIASGSLVLGSPYTMKFSTTNSSWILRDFYANPYSIPLGGILWSTITTPPNSSFVAPSGQCISTTTYATYWVAIGSPASGACPGGQFALVDMRGRVAAALDTLNASAAGRLTSSSTGCGTAMTSIGAVCANETQGSAISLAQLPTGITSANAAQAITVSTASHIPAANNNWAGTAITVTAGAVNIAFTGGSIGDLQTIGPTNNAISVTSNNTSGTARPNVMPVIGLIPYLRIL
jgi:hypothetical protein